MFAPFSPDRLEQLATTKPLQRRHSDISTPSLSPTSTPELPPTHPDDPDDPSHLLLPVILSGVTHHSPSSLKTRSSALNSTHITNILKGDKQLLSTGEAALSTVSPSQHLTPSLEPVPSQLPEPSRAPLSSMGRRLPFLQLWHLHTPIVRCTICLRAMQGWHLTRLITKSLRLLWER